MNAVVVAVVDVVVVVPPLHLIILDYIKAELAELNDRMCAVLVPVSIS